MKTTLLLLALAGCAPAQGRGAPDVCGFVYAPYRGPLAASADGLDATGRAWLHVREARLTGDAGFYGMAERAARCALMRAPDDVEARRALAHVLVQLHRFVEAEEVATPLVRSEGHWRDWMALSDARMERGDRAGAVEALDAALAQHANLPLYDRAAWLALQGGDPWRAVELARMAVAAGSPSDPEPLAWALTRLAQVVPARAEAESALAAALSLVPGYRPALLLRGQLAVLAGDAAGAREALAPLQDTALGRAALWEVDPAVDVAALERQDPRTVAAWLLPTAPDRSLVLLEAELSQRRDGVTLALAAEARRRTGADGAALAREALVASPGDPVTLWYAGLALQDAQLRGRALGYRDALLPSARALGEAEAIPWSARPAVEEAGF